MLDQSGGLRHTKSMKSIKLLIVEDNERLGPALKSGLTDTGRVTVAGVVAFGEEALAPLPPDADPGP